MKKTGPTRRSYWYPVPVYFHWHLLTFTSLATERQLKHNQSTMTEPENLISTSKSRWSVEEGGEWLFCICETTLLFGVKNLSKNLMTPIFHSQSFFDNCVKANRVYCIATLSALLISPRDGSQWRTPYWPMLPAIQWITRSKVVNDSDITRTLS